MTTVKLAETKRYSKKFIEDLITKVRMLSKKSDDDTVFNGLNLIYTEQKGEVFKGTFSAYYSDSPIDLSKVYFAVNDWRGGAHKFRNDAEFKNMLFKVKKTDAVAYVYTEYIDRVATLIYYSFRPMLDWIAISKVVRNPKGIWAKGIKESNLKGYDDNYLTKTKGYLHEIDTMYTINLVPLAKTPEGKKLYFVVEDSAGTVGLYYDCLTRKIDIGFGGIYDDAFPANDDLNFTLNMILSQNNGHLTYNAFKPLLNKIDEVLHTKLPSKSKKAIIEAIRDMYAMDWDWTEED